MAVVPSERAPGAAELGDRAVLPEATGENMEAPPSLEDTLEMTLLREVPDFRWRLDCRSWVPFAAALGQTHSGEGKELKDVLASSSFPLRILNGSHTSFLGLF